MKTKCPRCRSAEDWLYEECPSWVYWCGACRLPFEMDPDFWQVEPFLGMIESPEPTFEY